MDKYGRQVMFFRRAQWVTDKYILIMLGVFPLYCGLKLHAYTAITGAKFRFFAAATCLWLAAIFVLLVIGAVRGEKMRVSVRPAHMAVAVFLLVGAVSALVSEYGSVCLLGADRYDGYLTTLMCASIFYGVSFLGKPRRRYAWVLGISAAVCCAIAILQLGGMDPFWLYPEGRNYYDKYEALNAPFLGTIGNTGLLAAYLCLAAPLLITYAVLSKRQTDSLLLLPGAMALSVLVFCDVDAGILALAGTLLVTVPVAIRRRKASRIAAGVSGGVTALGLGALYFWPGESGTIYEISRVLHGELSDEFGSHRGQIWKQGWELIWEKPWLGSGPGTASERFHIRWSRYIEALGRERTVSVGNAHNVYLGYCITYGIFGGMAYISAVVATLITWIQRRRENALFPALGSAFFCYLIQDFFGIGLCLTAPMMWAVWGLLESGQTEIR